jgi:hypothetical protein
MIKEVPDWLQQMGARHGIRFRTRDTQLGQVLEAQRVCILGQHVRQVVQVIPEGSYLTLREFGGGLIFQLALADPCACDRYAEEVGCNNEPDEDEV